MREGFAAQSPYPKSSEDTKPCPTHPTASWILTTLRDGPPAPGYTNAKTPEGTGTGELNYIADIPHDRKRTSPAASCQIDLKLKLNRRVPNHCRVIRRDVSAETSGLARPVILAQQL
jgi:hypothetical protein